ncbi:MAG: sulfatase [Halobacteriales archaeon]
MSRPRNVLLVTVDCLRADRLASAISDGLAPNIEALAAEATRFDRAFTVANATDPSLTSMLTGRIPPNHGVLQNGWGLDAAVPTVAHRLRDAGFDTAGIVSVDHLAHEHSGLGHGFARYADGDGKYDAIYPILSRIYDTRAFNLAFGAVKDRGVGGVTVKDLLRRLGLIQLHERPATHVTADAIEAIDAVDEPFFAWVHYFDLHEPRNAPRRLRREHDDRYTAALRHVDAHVGRLVEALEARDALEETLVVLTADHGEALGEHGYTGHGRTLFDEELHVPLLLAHPGIPAQTVKAQVRTIDIAPTILATLGVDTGPLDGATLLADRAVDGPEDRPLVAMAYPPFGERYAVRTPAHKLVVDRDAGTVELYDLEADPRERRDIADASPELVERLLVHLRPWLERNETVAEQSVDEETEEMLAALGYVD